MTKKKKVVKNGEIAKFLESFHKKCNSSEVRSMARTRACDFTRERILTVSNLILYTMFRNELTTNKDINAYFTQIQKMNHIVSKQAVHQALAKMNPNVFTEMMKHFRESFYKSKFIKKLKGYVLLAVDGTKIEVPYSFMNLIRFGYQHSDKTKDIFDAGKSLSKASGIYDVTNGFFLDFQMKHNKTSEIPLFVSHIYRIRESLGKHKAIVITDRYYGSIELIALMEMLGLKYIIRAKKNFYKDKVKEIEMDGHIEVVIDEKWLKRFKYTEEIKEYTKENPSFDIRVIKYKYQYTNNKNTEEEAELIYFTNLDEAEFTYEDIIQTYKERWQIETAYKTMKSTLETERVNSINLNQIMCKIYGKVLMINLVGIIERELNEYLKDKKTKVMKNGFKVNLDNLLSLLMGSQILKLLYERVKKTKLLSELTYLTEIATKKNVPIRPDRHELRWGRFVASPPNYRFRTDGRNNPKLRHYQGGLMTMRS